KNQLGCFHRDVRFHTDLGRKIGIDHAADSACIHDPERLLAKFADGKKPVASHAGLIVNDRKPASGEAIEERGFADVGPADNGDGVHYSAFPCPAARSWLIPSTT